MFHCLIQRSNDPTSRLLVFLHLDESPQRREDSKCCSYRFVSASTIKSRDAIYRILSFPVSSQSMVFSVVHSSANILQRPGIYFCMRAGASRVAQCLMRMLYFLSFAPAILFLIGGADAKKTIPPTRLVTRAPSHLPSIRPTVSPTDHRVPTM